MRKKVIVLLSILSLLLLVGCEQTMKFKFYSGEKWKADAIVDFNADIFQGVGSFAGSLFDGSIPSGLFNPEIYLDPMMTIAKKAFRSAGVDFDWSYDRQKLKYHLSGESYRLLEQIGVITNLGGGTYQFVIDYDDIPFEIAGEYQPTLDQITDLLVDHVVEISVGKIYESNADKVSGSKAIWYNPDRIYLVFKPGSGGGFLKLLLWLVGIVLVIFLLSFIIKKTSRRTCYSCGAKVRKSYSECPSCGSSMEY